MGYLVDSLVSLGYLQIRKDPVDKRANVVRMSAKGIKMQQFAIEIGKRIEAEWAERMGVVEMGALRALLKLLASSIPDLPEQNSARRRGVDVPSNF
nr:MarR family transcriptional regulator [Diaphorobacter sp.]